jgi:hypothetical protein
MWRELAFMLDQLDSNCPKLGTTDIWKSESPETVEVVLRQGFGLLVGVRDREVGGSNPLAPTYKA